jgi:hypothetical protein
MDTEVIESGGPLPLLGADTPWAPGCEEEGAVRVEVNYRYLIFLPRGETYACRFAGSEVTGVYGPLDYRDVLFSTLPSFPYDNQIDDIAWVKSSVSDFIPCDSEYEEGMIWI